MAAWNGGGEMERDGGGGMVAVGWWREMIAAWVATVRWWRRDGSGGRMAAVGWWRWDGDAGWQDGGMEWQRRDGGVE
uniref:hypothetical protein n=1 Tax=Paenibacillus sonchi TaxID=373687 RepID=UPI001AE04BDA